MTPKQIERIRTKIVNIKRTLADEKRKYGGYDDSRGLRYMPPSYFIQLEDYKGGLTYLRWFSKTFSDDSGFPDFLFEWTLILFKCGKLVDANEKAIETLRANPYLFDKFLDRPLIPVAKKAWSNLAGIEFAETLKYSKDEPQLDDFAEWVMVNLNGWKLAV